MDRKRETIKQRATEYGVSEKFVRIVDRFMRKNDKILKRLAQK